MPNRLAILLLVLGLLGGYTFAGSSVKAQNEPLPFAVGDTLTLRFGAESKNAYVQDSHECTVAEIHGNYLRCAPSTSRVGADRTETWFSLRFVVQVLRKTER